MKTTLLLFLLLAATAQGAGLIINPYRFGSAPTVNDETAYWKLDEVAGNAVRVDSGPNGQDLTPSVANVQSTNAVISLGGNWPTGAAASFMSHGDSATLSCGDIDFTIGAWMKRYDTTARGAINKGGLSSAAVIEYGLYSSGSAWKFAVSNGTTLTTVETTAVSSLTWYYVVAWHDSTANTVNIMFNDGTPVSQAHSVGCQDGTGDFYMGAATDGFQFIGALDEVGFWKRLLTSGEKTYLYNSGAGKTCCPFVKLKNGDRLQYYVLARPLGVLHMPEQPQPLKL